MNFLKFSILSLLFFFIQSAEAQTAHEKYQEESIYLSNFSYVKNGQKYPLGFFQSKLGKELKSNTNAYTEFKKYKKNRNITSLLLIGGLTASFLGMSSAGDKPASNAELGLVIGGLAAYVVSIPFAFKAGKSYHKSVWIYNGDLLLPK